MTCDAILGVLSAELEAEEKSDFARLERVPSTHVWEFLHGFRTLKPQDRPLVKGAVAKLAARHFLEMSDWPELTLAEGSAYDRCRSPRVTDDTRWKWASLKSLKQVVRFYRSENPRDKASREAGLREGRMYPMPADVLEWADGLTPCKASDLRKRVKAEFAARFGMTQENSGGVWTYRSADSPIPFQVEIEYGGTFEQQLSYQISLDVPKLELQLRRLSFERLLLWQSAEWDFITEEGAEEAVSLLADRVTDVVGIVGRLSES